ncbi:MAG: TolC family protein [Phycisphaerae bacterium]|nr:TolC family protein [Phycisphaerae bacterium]
MIKIKTISLLFMALLFTGCLDNTNMQKQFRQNRQIRYRNQFSTRPDRQGNSAGEIESLAFVDGIYSINDCLLSALENNKDIKNAYFRQDQAKGQKIEAISTALPKASLNFDGLDVDTELPGDGSNYNGQLRVSQPLYLGGLIGTALDAAKAFDFLTSQELRLAIQQVHLHVQTSYLNVLLAKELVQVARQDLANAKELLIDTQKKYKYGAARKFDVLRSEVRVKTLAAELVKQQNACEVAMTVLYNAMGVSQNSKIELSDKLKFESVDVVIDKCNELALTRRAELLMGEANIRLAEDNVISKQAGNKPNVFLVGSYQQSYPGFMSFTGAGADWDRTGTVGVSMQWPFFSGFQVRGQVLQAKAVLQQQRVALVKTEQQVQLEVTQALLNLKNNKEFVLSQDGNVQNAQEALRLVKVDYREGVATSLDVINSQLALAQAQKDYYNAVQAYQVSLLDLHAAIGTIGEDNLPIEKNESTNIEVNK